nr:hypothetical protein [Candidatus Freyarchaeota archaeon]
MNVEAELREIRKQIIEISKKLDELLYEIEKRKKGTEIVEKTPRASMFASNTKLPSFTEEDRAKFHE